MEMAIMSNNILWQLWNLTFTIDGNQNYILIQGFDIHCREVAWHIVSVHYIFL